MKPVSFSYTVSVTLAGFGVAEFDDEMLGGNRDTLFRIQQNHRTIQQRLRRYLKSSL